MEMEISTAIMENNMEVLKKNYNHPAIPLLDTDSKELKLKMSFD
jgi:hypothetical protein